MPVTYINTTNPLKPVPSITVPQQIASQLGSGLKNPLTVVNNMWDTVSGIDKVKQDMYMILSTPVGRRFVNPDFGSMLPYYLFQGFNPLMNQQLQQTCITALNTWMPNIVLESVVVDQSQVANNIVTINISYLIKGTGSLQSLSLILTAPNSIQLAPSTFKILANPLFPTNS